MTKSIAGAVAQVQTLAAALSGVRATPSHPTDSISVYPFAASYIGAVETTKPSATLTISIYTIVTEIHISRKDMQRDITVLNAYPPAFTAAIWGDPTLAATVDTVLTCTGLYTPLEWGGIETRAWVFQTHCKITS